MRARIMPVDSCLSGVLSLMGIHHVHGDSPDDLRSGVRRMDHLSWIDVGLVERAEVSEHDLQQF